MAETFYTTAKNWVDVQTSVGGVVTFSPVDGQGNPIFSQVLAVQFTAEANVGLFTSLPVTALKSISGDRKTVLVNVAIGVVLAVPGATFQAAPDGTKVHAHLIGI